MGIVLLVEVKHIIIISEFEDGQLFKNQLIFNILR